MSKSHRSGFLKSLKEEFPCLTPEINSQEGVLSFEIDVVFRYLQNSIDQGQREVTLKLYNLLNHHFQNGSKDLKSLIGNAVSEDLILDNSKKRNREWAVKILPTELRKERESWFKFMGWEYKT